MDITFINVGYGESILVTCTGKNCTDGTFVMLIDGGSAMNSEYQGQSGRIRSYDFLEKKGIRHIDILVFSHVHEDHTCGLVPIIENIPVGQYWASVALNPLNFGKTLHAGYETGTTNWKMLSAVNAYSNIMEKLRGKDIRFIDGIHPDFYEQGEISIDVLGPDPEYRKSAEEKLNRVFTTANEKELDAALTETTEAMNNTSLTIRINWNGKRVLLGGDTNAQGFAYVMAENPELLRADVFKVGHHGQSDSVTWELVQTISPSVTICCASNDYANNSSNPKTFETIRDAMSGKNITYLFQDGCYNAEWNADISPRNGVTVHLENSGISWSIEEIS